MSQLSINQFISRIAKNDEVAQYVRKRLPSLHIDENTVRIQERKGEEELFAGLEKHCIGRDYARVSPIVTDSGYVLWVEDGRHDAVLQLLTLLVSDGDYDYADFFVRHNHGWFISSMRATAVVCGKEYKFRQTDHRLIDGFFTIDRLPF